ncbi:VOC family protein [Paenibacillus sp. CF384]|uniref:VOC family protein n=1 Tax=Paenibacillus sp. CF384 TaxID=1884382 RepID=UPI0008974CB1|nr:VOC family protein [Paenibacillus sp. CF384]SDX58246.1 Glyoxalase/Bleomycin resistance protein/Dioxygenase superfamily protein [Paenibacillus sp. CF384]
MQPLIKQEIIGVMHYVKDLESAAKWYCDTLGFTITAYDYRSFVELAIDGRYVMHLLQSEGDAGPVLQAPFTFDTADLRQVHRRLAELGVGPEPIKQYSDHACFSFKDCEGNALMICRFERR